MSEMVLLTNVGCGPCKVIKGKMDESSTDFSGIKIVDLSEGNAQEYLDKYPIRGVPALITDGKLYMGTDLIMKELGL